MSLALYPSRVRSNDVLGLHAPELPPLSLRRITVIPAVQLGQFSQNFGLGTTVANRATAVNADCTNSLLCLLRSGRLPLKVAVGLALTLVKAHESWSLRERQHANDALMVFNIERARRV